MSKLAYLADEGEPGIVFKQLSLPANTPFKIARLIVDPGQKTPLDQHQVQEVWLVEQGQAILTYQGNTQEIAAGDNIYFESMATHTVHNIGLHPLVIQSIWWS